MAPDNSTKPPPGRRSRFRKLLRKFTSPSRGFILVLVVGALSVLTVLGLSFSEQSRADLLGASNSRDLLAADGLAETGFQMGLRILADDPNVWSVKSVGWNFQEDGVGHTSRYGFNTNFDMPVDANYGAASSTPSGIQNHLPLPGGQLSSAPYNHRIDRAKCYIDGWQTMIWNEEPLNNNLGYAYAFKFDGTPGPYPSITINGIKYTYSPSRTQYVERRPADPRILLDTWMGQPLARLRRFKVRSGLNYGVVQVAITPRDGAINLNDMFDPRTAPGVAPGGINQRWGYHDYFWFNATSNSDPLASPDQHTMEYILGRRPEYAALHAEYVSYDVGAAPTRIPVSKYPNPASFTPNNIYDTNQFVANEPCGSVYIDNGEYNFRGVAEPNGRNDTMAANWPGDSTGSPPYPAWPASACVGRLKYINYFEPLIFYGANWKTASRYNFEAPRYPLWVAMQGPSMRYDGGGTGWWGGGLAPSSGGSPSSPGARWWPSGRGWSDPFWSGGAPVSGSVNPTSGLAPDFLFQGLGFDLMNPFRGGIGAGAADPRVHNLDDTGWGSTYHYAGAGMYGHPMPHSFQNHFQSSVALGRFWTDLEAAWYLGGSPGYTNKLGKWPDESWLDNWAFLGSAYDTMGLGTHWMPPTSHVWMPGFFNAIGQLDPYEVACGLQTNPRNMPPAKPAATYAHPAPKLSDDGLGLAGPHLLYAGRRAMIRAFGLQTNWGPGKSGNPDNRMFDAININVAPYEVVYGLLTPEKIPSMLHRSVVAPHLHWKSRYLDAAYQGMETFARYTPTGDPSKTNPHNPKSWPDTPYFPLTLSSTLGFDTQAPAILGKIGVNDATTYMAGAAGENPLHEMTAATPPQAANHAKTIGGEKGIPHRFGSVDYWGNFQEFILDDVLVCDTTHTNMVSFKETFNGQPNVRYLRAIGPAPWNYSIHKHYEPQPGSIKNWELPGTWSPEQYAKEPVGMIINRMDFRTSEPLTYLRVECKVGPQTKGTKTSPINLLQWDTPSPDPSVAADFQIVTYKAGSGEPADDVFTDCHYNLGLAPNSINATDPLDGTGPNGLVSSMMPRPNFLTELPDLYAQRLAQIPDNLLFITSVNMPDQQSVSPNNTVGAGGPAHPEGRAFNLATGTTVVSLGKDTDLRKNPLPTPHPLYGLPNPDYMLLYPGSPPSYHWSDQFRRYFPMTEVVPPKSTSGLGENPDFTTKTSIGYLAILKDTDPKTKQSDVANLDASTETSNWTTAPAPFLKMVDSCARDPLFPDTGSSNYPFIQPAIPVPKCDYPMEKAPFVPGISKDDSWRITRVGRKYQEIVADEIMDYQVNPWWPNPAAHFSEMSVPLDLQNYPSDTRVPSFVETSGNLILNYLNDYSNAGGLGKTMQSMFWSSYHQYQNQGNIWSQVPDYYAYWNRFWVRSAHDYARGMAVGDTAANFNARRSDYRAGYQYDAGLNPTEARGKYPICYQYWGVWWNGNDGKGGVAGTTKFPGGSTLLTNFWQDNVRDFPENTIEDQMGSEYRYMTGAAKAMYEVPGTLSSPMGGAIPAPAAQMAAAPGRNHPFKNWADMVAMIGHLVYRSPLTVKNLTRGIDYTSPRPARVAAGIRDRILGVNAYAVCHGPFADKRNVNQFFDGSKISTGVNGDALADSLQGYYGYDGAGDVLSGPKGGRTAAEAIVAIDGFWPISGNLGVFPDPSGSTAIGAPPEALLYPPRPAGMFADAGGFSGIPPFNTKSVDWEWHRRIDEWRGCDAGGLRVEQQYISERAANDIIVSLSNGQIGPIDFDGDGHITMTRQQELNTANSYEFDNPHGLYDPKFAGKGFWPNFPYHAKTGKLSICEYILPSKVAQNANYNNTGSMNYGVIAYANGNPGKTDCWQHCLEDDVITNCVTLPIKFHSNTFRMTVSVELTDKNYKNVSAVHRYQRVYSRLSDIPQGQSLVHGPFTGEFILHGSRAIDGVDPENSWLGADFGSE